MSIYSGFATRQQQQAYDGLLFDLIDVMQRRIIKFYTGQQADQHKFHTIVTTLYHHLSKMQENKYLQPKMSNAFKQLLNVTTTVDATYQELQKQLNGGDGNSNQAVVGQKDSLSFSRDKVSEDFKSGWGIGKIRHQIQLQIKDQFSSRGDTNPEDPLHYDRKVKRAVSTHFPKNFRSRKEFQRKGVHCDSYFKESEEERKNMQYVIRQYVSKGFHKRNKKRSFLE